MGGGLNCFSTLLKYLEEAIPAFPDIRTGTNKRFELRDATLSGLSVFFMQSPSFLSHQAMIQETKGKNNANSIFGIHKIPTPNQIRNLLDPVNPDLLISVFHKSYDFLKGQGIIDSFRSFNNNLLIPNDGTWFFSSPTIHCDKCLYKEHRDGTRTYYHSAITPVIVKPNSNMVISLPPEFIIPQDGVTKQDCENNAAKRWMDIKGLKYLKDYEITLLGDDLYSRQPICEKALSLNYNFIYVCKSSSHKYLYDWISSYDTKEDLNEMIIKKWTGKKRFYYRYRFINNVPLKDGDNALRVNWAELTILDENYKEKKHFAYITNHLISKNNIVSLIEAGRSKWKIENENNNTLKTKGYHLEHNFGHGKDNLSNLLVSLNLLSFLFHTVLEWFDRRYAFLRKNMPTRKAFFHDIKTLTKYLFFDNWGHLLTFMIKGLELEDPGG